MFVLLYFKTGIKRLYSAVGHGSGLYTVFRIIKNPCFSAKG